MKSKICLALACLVVSAFASVARADGFFDNSYVVQSKTLDLGASGRTHHYALFSANGDISSTDSNNEIDITGDVGANGNFSLSGAILNGDLYIKTGKTVSLGNKGNILGAKHQNGATDTMLNQGAADALTLSNNIDSLTVQNNGAYADGSSINMTNTKFSITGNAGDTVVLKLQDFILTGGELDLFGSATTKFIINVRGNFSLSNAAKVVNAGSLLASNVIFNYRGAGTASIGGGSQFNGILLAQNNTIQMTGASTVNGELIGKALLLSGGSKIGPTKPPVVSP